MQWALILIVTIFAAEGPPVEYKFERGEFTNTNDCAMASNALLLDIEQRKLHYKRDPKIRNVGFHVECVDTWRDGRPVSDQE